MADKTLIDLLKQIEKDHGENSILLLNDDYISPIIESISTGSIKIDRILGVEGLPKGRIIEIYGPESSGKTTLCLQVIASAQKLTDGKYCAIIDAEHALDMMYAEKLGVKTKDLVLSQPECGEQALNICEDLIKSGKFSVIVVDSVAALTPKAEIEGEMGDINMGLHARLMSQAMRKLTSLVSRSGTTLIFTNQLRDKIGVMFGSPETTTGGKALKFYASVRIDMRRLKQIKDGDNVIGNIIKVKIVKNKVAPPYKETETEIIYNEGISIINEIIDIAVETGIIKKGGAWYSYNEIKLQGKDAFKNYLRTNADVLEELDKVVRNG